MLPYIAIIWDNFHFIQFLEENYFAKRDQGSLQKQRIFIYRSYVYVSILLNQPMYDISAPILHSPVYTSLKENKFKYWFWDRTNISYVTSLFIYVKEKRQNAYYNVQWFLIKYNLWRRIQLSTSRRKTQESASHIPYVFFPRVPNSLLKDCTKRFGTEIK